MSGKKPSIIVLLALALVVTSVQAVAPTTRADLEPPTLVALHANGAAPTDVLADLTRQTGVPLPTREGMFAPASNAPAPVITLDLQHAPFWTALAAVCNQCDAQAQDSQGTPGRPLLIADGFGEKFLGGPVDNCGLFIVETEQIARERFAKLIPGSHTVDRYDEVWFNVYIDPKAKLSSMDGIRLTEATDDHGESLLPADNRPVPFIDNFDLLVQPRCPLNIPPDGARTLARLRGSMDISMTATEQRIEIPDISAALHRSATLGRWVFQITSFSAPGRAATVDLTLREKNNNNENGAIERLLRQITLVDANGQVMTGIGKARWIGDCDVCSYQATFIGQRKLQPPIKFAWSIPDAIAKITVPFEFRDLPLPAP